jgi:hypothetical protein
MIAPRKPSFQLIALFDLLMIVIFAQYLDVQATTEQVTQTAQVETEQLKSDLAQLASAREADRVAMQALAAQSNDLVAQLEQQRSLRTQLASDLAASRVRADQSQAGLEAASRLLTTWLGKHRAIIEKSLAPLAQQQQTASREELRRVLAGSPNAAQRHLLTWGELEKRVDLWQLHLTEEGLVRCTVAGRTEEFRADTAARFESELIRLYRGIPEPKAMVLMLLSWGDVDLKTRNVATAALESATQKLRAETDRRSRFELGILGFLPDDRLAPLR